MRECKDDLLETLEANLQKQYHFRTVDHQLKVYGYCEECDAKRQKEGEETDSSIEQA